MKLCVLGSGSAGNCAVLSYQSCHVLIDAGLSASQIVSRLGDVGLTPETLSGILITHEHGDHCRGLDVLTKRHPVPVYCNIQTKEMLRESIKSEKQWRLIQCGQRFHVGPLAIDSFSVPHDAVDPMGFVIRLGASALGVLSDVGHVTNAIRHRLAGIHTLFVEANYDGTLLQNDTKRPWSTKQRIMSRHGHLSNHQTAELVAELAHPELERIVLGHLSQDCNSPELARAAITGTLAALGLADVDIICAAQDLPTAWMGVRQRHPLPSSPVPAKVSAMPSYPLVQGELF